MVALVPKGDGGSGLKFWVCTHELSQGLSARQVERHIGSFNAVSWGDIGDATTKRKVVYLKQIHMAEEYTPSGGWPVVMYLKYLGPRPI